MKVSMRYDNVIKRRGLIIRVHRLRYLRYPKSKFSIGRKIGSIDRKTYSIDPASIEQQSSQAYSNQIFNRNFDQSKIWKNQFFEKQSILMQKLLKAQCLMNKMHEYEMKSFSKTLKFNQDLPKTRFSINLSSSLKL